MCDPRLIGWQWPEAAKYISPLSVFDPPSAFAKTFVETLPVQSGYTTILDIGCGSGIIGIYSLVIKKAKFVTFNDVQDSAILETRANVAMHIQQGSISDVQVAARKCDFADIPASTIAAHNLIVFNMPQLPEDLVNKNYLVKVREDPAMRLFRLGGGDGLAVADRFLAWYAALEPPKPDAVILLSSFLGRQRIARAIESHQIRWKILVETRVPLRKILADKAEEFVADQFEREDRSLDENLPGDPAGRWSKRLLTIHLSGSTA